MFVDPNNLIGHLITPFKQLSCSEPACPQEGDIFSLSELSLTRGFIVVHTDSVQLQVAVTVVSSCWVDAVLVTDHFPELNEHTDQHIISAQTTSRINQSRKHMKTINVLLSFRPQPHTCGSL